MVELFICGMGKRFSSKYSSHFQKTRSNKRTFSKWKSSHSSNGPEDSNVRNHLSNLKGLNNDYEDIDIINKESTSNSNNFSSNQLLSSKKFNKIEAIDRMDEQMGFSRYQEPIIRKGWLINCHSVSLLNLYLVIINF